VLDFILGVASCVEDLDTPILPVGNVDQLALLVYRDIVGEREEPECQLSRLPAILRRLSPLRGIYALLRQLHYTIVAIA
jgi:hypothetical protein